MNSECCICFEIVRSENQQPFATRCGHIFHEHCIKSCFDKQGKCPQCNQIINSSELIRLYVNHPEASAEAKDEMIERLKSELNELSEKAQLQYDLIGSLNRQITFYEKEKSNVTCSQSPTSGATSRTLRVARGQIAPAKLKLEDKPLDTAGPSFSTNSNVRMASNSSTGLPPQPFGASNFIGSGNDVTCPTFTFEGANPTKKSIPMASASSVSPSKCDPLSNLVNARPTPFSSNFNTITAADMLADIFSPAAFESSNIFGGEGRNSQATFESRNPTKSQTSAGVNMSTSSSRPLSKFESVSLEAKRDLYKEIGLLIFGGNSSELSKPFEHRQRITARPKNNYTGILGSQNPKSATDSSSLVLGSTKNKGVSTSTRPSNQPTFGESAFFKTELKSTLFASIKASQATSVFGTTSTTANTPFNASGVNRRNLFMPPKSQFTTSNVGCKPKVTTVTTTSTASATSISVSPSDFFGVSPDKTKTASISNKSFAFGNTSKSSDSLSPGFFSNRWRFDEADSSGANLNQNLNQFFSSIPKGSFLSGGCGDAPTETIVVDSSPSISTDSFNNVDSNSILDLEEESSVEKVLDRRIRDGKVEYLLKWKGHSHVFNTWAQDTDSSYSDLIAAFENERQKTTAETEENIVEMAEKE